MSMRIKTIVLALVVLALQAQAEPVSQSQAAVAARAWIRSGSVLGVRFNRDDRVTSVRTVAVNQDAALHAVSLAKGGVVFVAGDTEDDPVMAFAAAAPSKDSPLWDILKRDVYLRSLVRRQPAAGATAGAVRTTSGTVARKAAAVTRKWTSLLGGGMGATAGTGTAVVPNSISEKDAPVVISDLRVEPLLKSRWGQTDVSDDGGEVALPCYNYYTTNGVPCGCTATAVSQIMYYHRFPETLPELLTKTCMVDGVSQELTVVASEDDPTLPKPYDWAKMVPVPTVETPVESLEAIGHLTYDVAVLLGSEFTPELTSALPTDVPGVFKTMGYAGAYVYWDDRSWHYDAYSLNADSALRNRLIFSNLDAKLPVQLAIYGYAKHDGQLTTQWGGHAVVADGYGFATVDGAATSYVHINLGWEGQDDAWYNLPEIDTAKAGASYTDDSGYDFRFLGGVTYNITTNEVAEGKELLTGRLTDGSGGAYATATVTATDEDGNEATVRPDERGVFCFWVEGDRRYALSAKSDDGRLLGAGDLPVFVSKTVADQQSVVAYKNLAGNYWGADIVIGEACVRIGEDYYTTLDHALAAVKDGDRIEILRPTTLVRPATLGAGSYELVAVTEDAAAAAVTCRNGAQLTLEDGASVFFTNVVFRSEPAATVVKVMAGGRASVAGVAVFDDLCSGVDGIVTEAVNGFVLAGELKNGLTLRCLATVGTGDFGSYACETEVAKACAGKIISRDGAQRAGTWSSELIPGSGLLKWQDNADVVREVAVAGATVGAAEPVYYRSLDQLLADCPTGDVQIELLRAKASLGRTVDVVGRNLILRSSCEGGTVVSADERYAGFVVGSGGRVVVGNAVFTGTVDTTFIRIVDGGAFTLDEGAKVVGLTCRFSLPDNTKTYGPIAVTKGTLTMLKGSEISGCSAAGTSGKAKWGGAVYLGGTDCTLELLGGKITDCRATEFGGGVYAAGASVIKLAGEPVVSGNTAGIAEKSNLYLADAAARIVVVGALTGGTVGIRFAGDGNGPGEKFADVAAGVNVAADSFANDADGSLKADVSLQTLVWVAKPVGPQPLPESERARAVAATKVGDTLLYYATFEDAVASLTGSADILILTDAFYGADLEIAYPVTVYSAGETVRTLQRTNDVSLTVRTDAALCVSNLCICGYTKKMTQKTLVAVDGGSLSLLAGAKLADVRGIGNRACGAVKVWHSGILTMASGSVVSNCWNYYANPDDLAGCGGGVVIDDGTAFLRGGEITDCRAYTGAGLCAANGSSVYVSGDIRIDGNRNLDEPYGRSSNLTVQDHSCLVLDGEFTGLIGYTEGAQKENPSVFGSVADDFDGTAALLAESARHFVNDENRDMGLAVAGADGRILVWSDCVDPDGSFVLAGKDYVLVPGDPALIPVPSAEDDLVYDGSEQVGVTPAHGVVLSGNTGTGSGGYEAVAVLKAGFAWQDGTTTDAVIPWRIAKADYDMSGVVFENRTVTYDGNEHSLTVTGTLPDGLAVAYVGNPQQLAGRYEIIARFCGDENHNPVGDLTATLTIAKATYDMSRIVFADVDFAADGTKKSVFVGGELPEGVTVEYANNGQSEPGVYEVTARFSGDGRNYEPIGDKTAVMTIYESELQKGDDPKPGPGPVVDFAITSFAPKADGTYQVTIAPAVKGCLYTLRVSDDLQSWTDVGVGKVADDAGSLTFEASASDEKKYWQVVGDVPVQGQKQ